MKKTWLVYNGFYAYGFGNVAMPVEAEDEKEAIDIAKPLFEERYYPGEYTAKEIKMHHFYHIGRD